MPPKKVRLTDHMLGRILEIKDRLIMCELELDDIYECHAEFEQIRSVWLEYKSNVVAAKNDITMYIRALRAEPAMSEIMDMLEQCKARSTQLVDDDPILTYLQSEFLEVDKIINHGKRPWVARLNRAEFICDEWEAYMRTPDVQRMYSQYVRIKPLKNDYDKPKRKVLTDDEQLWQDYMSMADR